MNLQGRRFSQSQGDWTTIQCPEWRTQSIPNAATAHYAEGTRSKLLRVEAGITRPQLEEARSKLVDSLNQAVVEYVRRNDGSGVAPVYTLSCQTEIAYKSVPEMVEIRNRTSYDCMLRILEWSFNLPRGEPSLFVPVIHPEGGFFFFSKSLQFFFLENRKTRRFSSVYFSSRNQTGGKYQAKFEKFRDRPHRPLRPHRPPMRSVRSPRSGWSLPEFPRTPLIVGGPLRISTDPRTDFFFVSKNSQNNFAFAAGLRGVDDRCYNHVAESRVGTPDLLSPDLPTGHPLQFIENQIIAPGSEPTSLTSQGIRANAFYADTSNDNTRGVLVGEFIPPPPPQARSTVPTRAKARMGPRTSFQFTMVEPEPCILFDHVKARLPTCDPDPLGDIPLRADHCVSAHREGMSRYVLSTDQASPLSSS
jgi:hypothetical protein